MTWLVEVADDAHAALGEGPCWDERIDALLWLDITAGVVHRYDPVSGRRDSTNVGQPVSAIVPRASGGYVLAVRDGFAFMTGWGEPIDLVAPVEEMIPGNRMNDGKCDTGGRFWAGTMAEDETPGAGSLYRLGLEHSAAQVLTGVTCSNGLAWSLDDSSLYYIDTGTRRVDVFHYEPVEGAVSRRRSLIEIPASQGEPDGMTIDVDGCLWVALWGGASICRFTPDGRLDRSIDLPASYVTSCTFGGPSLEDLYITTAAPVDGQSPNQPHAGGLFICHPGVQGLTTRQYRG